MSVNQDKTIKNKKYILSIIFLLLLIVVTFVIIFSKYNFLDVLNIITKVDYKWILLGISMIFIYIFFEGMATREVFKSMEITTTIRDNFMYSAIDYYFCAVTPSASGGQPMVAYYMAKDKLDISKVSLTLLINTALFKIVLLFLSLVCIIVCPKYVFDYPIMIALFFIGFCINIGLIALCFLASFKRNWIENIGIRLILFGYRHKIIKRPIYLCRKYHILMNNYEQGARLIFKHKRYFIRALLYNLIQRVAFFSISFFVYLAFKGQSAVAEATFWELFSIQVLIALCVDSLPLPGGVGISEYLYVILLGGIYIVGESNIIGSAMLLTRAINFYIPLIITFIIFVIKHILVIKKAKRGSL